MRRRFHPVLACAAALSATAAMAQTAPPVSGVTVQGQPLTKENAPKLAFDFVRTYTASTVKIQQVPRWHDPICAQVIGLPDAQAAEVKGRIDEVAKDVGISAAPAGCMANIEVVFTAQPQKIVDDFAKGKEWILGYYHNDPKVRVVSQPIQAWYVTATLGGAASNAMAFAYTGSATPPASTATQGSAKVMDSPDSYTPTGTGDSKFTSNLQSVFLNAFIVVDTSRAQGKSVGVLSDYVSMLALSEPRSLGGGCRTLPSVTDLFVSGCAGGAADGLSPTDAAYLTALYQANPEARNVSEESDISDRMAKMLVPSNVVAR